MDELDCVVVGAGVVGLAIARQLARSGREVLLIEARGTFGEETSSRNSEVIHAGLYYEPNSLKARMCVAGKNALYQFAESHGVAFRRCGKYVVAADQSDMAALERLKSNAEACGVDDLEWLSGPDACASEPNLSAVGALVSPSTGILDSHNFMLALLGDLEDAGGQAAYWSNAIGGTVENSGHKLKVRNADGSVSTIDCRVLINSAGLGAQALASGLAGHDHERIPARHLCKGNYFTLAGKAPFSRLIYPAPGTASLGLHYTLDLGGQARFGPDVEWIDKVDYHVDVNRVHPFCDAIRRYYPALRNDALEAAYSGIRPKLQAEGEPAADFRIDGPADHSIDGLVNLYGIESPGLTSSLAIADYVSQLIA
jgi:L-2-hydroxyglutarate oxidase LhgO